MSRLPAFAKATARRALDMTGLIGTPRCGVCDQRSALSLPHQLESKPRIEFAVVVRAAAGQTGDGMPYSLHSREIALAIWTLVKEAANTLAHWKSMTTLLVADF